MKHEQSLGSSTEEIHSAFPSPPFFLLTFSFPPFSLSSSFHLHFFSAPLPVFVYCLPAIFPSFFPSYRSMVVALKTTSTCLRPNLGKGGVITSLLFSLLSVEQGSSGLYDHLPISIVNSFCVLEGCMCVYMCVCMCAYMCICVYVYIVYMCVCMCAHVLYVYIGVYVCLCIYTHMIVCICVFTCVYV